MDLKKINRHIKTIGRISRWLWVKGWAEQNAGNISLNITGQLDINKNALGLFDFVEMDIPYDEVDEQLFIVSATGARFRDMAEKPADGVLVVFISRTHGGYYIISHDNVDLRPSSEFISHLAMQAEFIREGKGRSAILHTHPPEIITMTHEPGMDNSEALSNILWQMHTEVPVFLNDGVGFASFSVPGSEELADKSMELLKEHRIVIWEKHGALATGENLIECFDLLDIAEKAASIYLKAKSAGFKPTGLNENQIIDIRKFWGV